MRYLGLLITLLRLGIPLLRVDGALRVGLLRALVGFVLFIALTF